MRQWMKEMVTIGLFIGIFLILLGLSIRYTYKVYDYLIHNPIRVFHPNPTLTTKYPILRNIDRMLMFTAGWDWYKVKNISNGKIYIIRFGWDNRNKCDDIRIWDIDTRKESRITREQYFNEYEDINKKGIGQWEHYPKNIDEAIEMYNK